MNLLSFFAYKNPDIIPLEGKISDNCSNKSSATEYSCIRPLKSKSTDKYDISNCDRYYEHNIDPCYQYIQVRPMQYRRQYAPTLAPMSNLRPTIHSFGPMRSAHITNVGQNDSQSQPYDKVYEDWLKYKNSLPLNTRSLLPAEQLMPPELYTTPPPSLYSNTNMNPLNVIQMCELEPRLHLEPRSLVADSRSCSNSPPVRFNTDNNSVYFSKSVQDTTTNTLTHMKSNTNDWISSVYSYGTLGVTVRYKVKEFKETDLRTKVNLSHYYFYNIINKRSNKLAITISTMERHTHRQHI